MRFYCLVNPVSGGKKGQMLLSLLQDLKAKRNLIGEAVKMDLTRLPEQINESLNYSATLVAGGDGSINQIYQHLGDKTLKLGILPLGTGNDLARESGIRQPCSRGNLSEMLKTLSMANTQDLALWKVEFGQNYEKSFLFSNYLSLGFDAAVVADVEMWRKQKPKAFRVMPRASNRLAYALASLKNLWGSGKFSCKIDAAQGTQHECRQQSGLQSALLFSNIRSIMGLGVSNPHSNPCDQYLEATQVCSPFNYLGMLAPPIPRGRLLGSSSSWEISDLDGDVPVQIDGEAKPEIRGNKIRISFARSIQLLWPNK